MYDVRTSWYTSDVQAKVSKTLDEVLKVLSLNSNLSFENKNLFSFSDNKILTPIGNIFPLFLNQKSKLKDQIVDLNLLREFIYKLTSEKSIVRLNHIGFCYKVSSQTEEKERLLKLVRKTKFHLYQEPSNDAGLWLFLGNTKNWEDPLIELLPVEKTDDKWIDYWLPHIQIDIDTTLNAEEIKKIDQSIFGKSISPFEIVIDGITYIVRNRLGTVDGVNIALDLATNSRNVKYQRQHILKRIS